MSALSVGVLELRTTHGIFSRRGNAAQVLRRIHQAATVAPAPPPQTLRVPQIVYHGQRESGLSQKLLKLQNVSLDLIDVAQATNDPSSVVPISYSDEELYALYEDLKVNHESLPQIAGTSDSLEARKENDMAIIEAMEDRLLVVHDTSSIVPSSHGLAKRLSGMRVYEATPVSTISQTSQRHERVLDLVEVALDRLDSARLPLSSIATEEVHKEAKHCIPVGLVSSSEWVALVRICIYEGDVGAAERTVHLMQRVGLTPPEDVVNEVLQVYASNGDIDRFESFMGGVIAGSPTEIQRDLHIKACLIKVSNRDPSSSHGPRFPKFPSNALDVLHRYEASGHFPPLKSYTRVITALFNVRTSPSSSPRLGHSAAYAQAWDLFAHMRYVAHPTPDAHLYALMIRACGSTARVEPERASDLWTEMQENRIQPTSGAYQAIILVFGRAGQQWLGEAIRLAREMQQVYPLEVANGKRMWCALLEGCKRIGDLSRARWILAEALRTNAKDDRAGNQGPEATVDAKMMTHIFHTYASYKPPFDRSATRLVDECSTPRDESSSASPTNTPAGAAELDRWMDGSAASFSRLPPQTSADVIAEAQVLFERILEDTRASPRQVHERRPQDPLSGKFRDVQLTPPLLNAYMSVFYAHSSIEHIVEVFRTVFGTTSSPAFQGNAQTYVDALERCSLAPKEERLVAVRWAQDLWSRWELVELQATANGYEDVGTFARLIERTHTAMRRVLVLAGDLDGALSLLRKFVARYPPTAVFPSGPSIRSSPVSDTSIVAGAGGAPVPHQLSTITLFAKPPILSTRTTLTNSKSSGPSSTPVGKPLVRLTSAVGPRDDRVPPLIGFSDVELLHHRLAARRRVKDLGYLKWACEAYRGALRKRREAMLGAVPKTNGSQDVD
ncbi:hypothetical protein ID866_1866 [Astraeus odoratus]|nr:hypothetical protein ID866_1866 [Astraeus odoratus]